MTMADFWECSLFEFTSAVTGWNRSQGGGPDTAPPTDEEFERMLEGAGLA